MKKILALFALWLCVGLAYGQFTSVTATITDSDGQTWNNGNWTATIYNPYPANPPSIGGVPLTTEQINLAGSMNGSGVLTATMADNSLVAPTGTQWAFTICPDASTQCSTMITAVTGGSENLSTILSSQLRQLRFSASSPATPSAYGYSDAEVYPRPLPGGQYFNVTSSISRQWNGTSWQNFNTGSGPANPNGSEQYNNNGSFGPTKKVIATAFTGADIGAKVNAAIAALSGMGEVEIPAGTYTQTTTIIKPRSIILTGQGPGTLLNYTGTGTAIQIVDSSGPDAYFAYLGGLENLHIHGSSTATGVAIYFGCNLGSSLACTNYYGDNQFINNVVINNFNTDLEFGSNAFLLHFQNMSISGQNLIGITSDPANTYNSGENIEFIGGAISPQQVAVNTQPLNFYSTSFDVIPSNTYPSFVNTPVSCVNCHYEALSGVGPMFTAADGEALVMLGGIVEYDEGTTPIPYVVGYTGTNSTLFLNGVDMATNAPSASEIVNDTTSGTKNIYIYGLIDSFPGGTSIMQAGYNLLQTGVNIQAGGNFAPYTSQGSHQYTMNGGLLAAPNGGANELFGSSGALELNPDQSGTTNIVYLTDTAFTAANQYFATNIGYQVGGIYVIDNTRAANFTTLVIGSGNIITNSSLLPQVGTPTVNKAACIKSVGPPVIIGYCSTVVSSSGGCTCN